MSGPSEWLRRKARNQAIRFSRSFGARLPSVFGAPSRPVFIIGCARSGTTLADRLLSYHRDVAVWSEANYVWDPGWYPWRPDVSHLTPLEYDPAEFTRRWWEEAQARKPNILAAFGAYQKILRRPVFANKSPFHTFRIPHLLEWFPDARFLHVVRDGRAVAYSYARHQSRGDKLREWPRTERQRFQRSFDALAVRLARFWSDCIEEVANQDEELSLSSRGRLVEIHYEELCTAPGAVMARAAETLGLEPRRFRAALTEVDTRSRNFKWRDALSPESASRLEAATRPALTRLGYD